MTTLRWEDFHRVIVTKEIRSLDAQIQWCEEHLEKDTWACYVTHFTFSNPEDATWFALEWSMKNG